MTTTLARIFIKKLARRSYAVNLSANQAVWTQDSVVKSNLKEISIPNRTAVEHVWENLDKWADKTALTCGVTDHCISYHMLYKKSRSFAAQLRSKFKIANSDVVCVMMHNIPDYAVVLLGIIEAGATATTVNPIYTSYEVHRQILLSEPKVLIGTIESVPVLKEAMKLVKRNIPIITCGGNKPLPPGTTCFQELVDDIHVNLESLKGVNTNPENVILLPYSSGTTGLPKGVELTNRNIVAQFMQQDDENIRHYNETTRLHQDSVLAVLPFYHIYGMIVTLLHKLTVGVKIVTLPKFRPDTFVSALDKHKIHLFCAAPPLVLFLGSYAGIEAKHLESIKKITCGAAPLPKPDIDRVLEKAKNTELIQIYGLTETSPLVTTLCPGSRQYTSVGIPLPSTEVKIIDSNSQNLGPNRQGELLIRGPQVMKGYRNNIEATNNAITKDGWFKSGDLASIDENGYVTIADRLKELIKVKGYQVAPAELESIIKEHPNVLDAGVIGVPDQTAGELPKAFVVLKDGHNAEAQDISKFLAEKVVEYKRIKDVVFLKSLPKNPSGKLLRRVLKEKNSSVTE
ncbi:hypothetical protein ACJJTC_006392 [Scirpophaga incertulas]